MERWRWRGIIVEQAVEMARYHCGDGAVALWSDGDGVRRNLQGHRSGLKVASRFSFSRVTFSEGCVTFQFFSRHFSEGRITFQFFARHFL